MSQENGNKASLKQFFKNLIRIKQPEEMMEQANKAGLEKSLGAWDLIILGVGVIIGSGIFAVVGIAAAGSEQTAGAGPALVISMVIAAIACIFSALCYSEFATMIPVAGGAYTYTFATLGEFAAWMVGWVLIIEYTIGFIAVACAWSNHFMQFIKGFPAIYDWISSLPVWLVNDTNTAVKIVQSQGLDPAQTIPSVFGFPISFNLPALIMILITTLFLVKGTKDSTKMAGVMVAIKLGVIALFVVTGIFYIKPENWIPFAPNGFDGIFMGAFIIFFAYIGFDALATATEECKNPQKDLPIGIIGSLIITTLVYVSVALVLTGMQPTSGTFIPMDFLKAPMAYVMTQVGQNQIAGLISIGSLAGLTSVLLVMELAATRILYAMSRDNFISARFQKLHPKYKTPYVLTWVVGILCIIGTLTLDLNVAAELCNFGTITSFIIVCVAVLILRHTQPDRKRPFKVPFSPLFPLLGIICCVSLMFYSTKSLSASSLIFPAWLVLGAIIYFTYGYQNNRKCLALKENNNIENKDLNNKDTLDETANIKCS